MNDFYLNIPASDSFKEIFEKAIYHEVPDDWFIVITDVIGSTKAIEAGRYKDVNVAGGLAAIAIANAFDDMNFPFVFGGDGVTFLVPGDIADHLADILADTSIKVQELFQLDLRVGMVNVAEIKKAGHDIALAKLKISQYYNQAIIRGSGADYAESLVKSKETDRYLIKEKKDPSVTADFNGFTCRWKDIESVHGETISIIVKLREDNTEQRDKLYLDVLDEITKIFGAEEKHHPLSEEKLHVSSSSEFLGREAKAQAGNSSGLKYLLKLLKIKFETWMTRFAMKFNISLKAFWYDLSKLKGYQVLSSDFKKYDGTLKMVIAGSTDAREHLEKYLEELYSKKRIFYGLHVTDRALMTCLLHEGSEREVHFVDGADGGYALAAKQLKGQIKNA